MRRCRIKLPNRCYHLISRVAHRAYFLDGDERTRLVDFVRRVAEFSGVKLLAYSAMSNHFHVFVNAGIVDWPDGYEWCSYAAACRGDETARSGYDFVYGGKGRPWSELKELHDISIRQMLKEREWKDSEDVELARANKRPDRRGKTFAAGIETPGYIPQVIAKGDNVCAVRLMQLLQWEPKSPAYLRTTLGIASREYFTKAYLRPLMETGLIERSDPVHPNSPQQKYALTKDGKRRIGRVAPL